MMRLFTPRLIPAAFIISLAASASSTANEPGEVAIGTLSCKAQWNEFCEDEKIISVPEGHILCKYTVTAKEQAGDSSYEVVSSDTKSVRVKFNAKGNRDRFKQQSATIVLNVSLLGVRENSDCSSAIGITAAPLQKPLSVPEAPIEEKKLTPEIKPAAVPATGTSTQPKVHACACSQWIDAGKVSNCLEKGHGRDNVPCESFATTIQCVISKEECRELQKDDCFQVMGLNQTTSQKRIFVADSPYCQALIKN